MTRPLSNHLRRRVVEAVDGGMARRAAARFGVAVSTSIKWVEAWHRTGRYEPRPQGGANRSHRIEAHAEAIVGLIDATPNMTLAEIADRLQAAHGLTVAESTVRRFLERRGITFKKNRSRQRAAAA